MSFSIFRPLVSFAIVAVLSVPALADRALQPARSSDRANSALRTALVIGNAHYKESPLANPANDARDMARTLRELGFDVTELIDANQKAMKQAVSGFGNKLRRGGTGVFYYAGHGIQVKGGNYLVPVDMQIKSESEVEYEAVDVGFVLAQMEDAKNPLNIVILDACRNNPFPRATRSAARGLAQMNAPTGTFIAYATAPGSVAADGQGKNGLYTQELLRAMKQPGLGVEEMFKQVRIAVKGKSGNQQVPWDSSSLTGHFSFARGDSTLGTSARPVASEPDKASAANDDERRWLNER